MIYPVLRGIHVIGLVRGQRELLRGLNVFYTCRVHRCEPTVGAIKKTFCVWVIRALTPVAIGAARNQIGRDNPPRAGLAVVEVGEA